MFRENMTVEQIDPIHLGRYQVRYLLHGGNTTFHLCNVESETDLNVLQFNARKYQDRSILIPDNKEPTRKSFAFVINEPDYLIRSIYQKILVYQFAFEGESLIIVGREYPELFDQIGFSVLLQSIEDPEDYMVKRLVPTENRTSYHIISESYHGLDAVPDDVSHRTKNRGVRLDKRMIIGHDGKFSTPAQIHGRSIVIVNPEFQSYAKARKDNIPVSAWCNIWFRGGISDRAAIQAISTEEFRNWFSKDAPEDWMKLISKTKDIVFVGYSFNTVVRARQIIERWKKRAGTTE